MAKTAERQARDTERRANARAAGRTDAALHAAGTSVRATGSAAPVRPVRPADDIADQIVRLTELRDASIVTADEFATKKSELLARM